MGVELTDKKNMNKLRELEAMGLSRRADYTLKQTESTANQIKCGKRKKVPKSTLQPKKKVKKEIQTKKTNDYPKIKFQSLDNYQQSFILPNLINCNTLTEKYKLLEKVGEGSYGVVYRAMHKKNDGIYALKRLKPLKSFTSHFREISALKRISPHENLVSLHEVIVGGNSTTTGDGKDLNTVYLVQDFCQNDLQAIIDAKAYTPDNPAFLVPHVKAIIKQIFLGLNHLHVHKIIHRDLKCSNILLSEGGVIKITDFGLTRRENQHIPSTPGVVTLFYRAPELVYGIDERVNFQSTKIDSWAAGCVLAELINNQVLFPCRSELDLIHLHVQLLGCPDPKEWPEFNTSKVTLRLQPLNKIGDRFPKFTKSTVDLLTGLLTYNPVKRWSMKACLDFADFWVSKPQPSDRLMIPSFPELRKVSEVT